MLPSVLDLSFPLLRKRQTSSSQPSRPPPTNRPNHLRKCPLRAAATVATSAIMTDTRPATKTIFKMLKNRPRKNRGGGQRAGGAAAAGPSSAQNPTVSGYASLNFPDHFLIFPILRLFIRSSGHFLSFLALSSLCQHRLNLPVGGHPQGPAIAFDCFPSLVSELYHLSSCFISCFQISLDLFPAVKRVFQGCLSSLSCYWPLVLFQRQDTCFGFS
jgi:hypothetical protein